MKKKLINKGVILQYILILIGSCICAFGTLMFLRSNGIAPGGITGLSIVLESKIGIPYNIIYIIFNVIILGIALITLGKGIGFKTVWGIICISSWMSILIPVIDEPFTNDLLLASIFGGVFSGVGLGIIITVRGSVGGTDLIGQIINKYVKSISIPKLMMIMDVCVIVAAGVVSKNIDISLYSMITLFVSVQLADFIIEGMNYSKAYFIITDKGEEVGNKIISDLGKTATILDGKGSYSKKDKNLIICVVPRSQVSRFKRIVHEIDETAFIFGTKIQEVMNGVLKK